jgi:hypothetical protein
MSSDAVITPAVQARLSLLENEHGQLTPAIVVADAKDETSPLHALFDWDVTDAAEKWWLAQARQIIRSVKLVITTEEVTVKTPHYVRDPSVPPDAQGYISIARLQRDPVAAKQSLLLEFNRAQSALLRARSLAVVLGLEDEIDHLIERLTYARTQVQPPTDEASSSQPTA